MPELPDIAIYREALERRILGAEITGLRVASPFLVRSVDPPIRAAAALVAGNQTLKRALTDPHLFAGVGNAYSDEILHATGLSPIAMTTRLGDEEVDRLYEATRATLLAWIERGRREVGDGWPTKVTAFRPAMAAHGRYGKPCPVCGTPIQRIVRADNETNYCPRCQTGGKLLADRALSPLLKKDWPRTVDELENRRKTP